MTRPALIGDIGGTNARFALVTPGECAPRNIRTLPCADYPTLVDAAHAYLHAIGHAADQAPHEACLAVACPVHGDKIRMTNNHWEFSRSTAQSQLGLGVFKIINDFTAQALGIPHVPVHELVAIGDGQACERSVRLVIGPGTGLGVAGVFPGLHAWIPLNTEGGHVTFAPTDAQEQALLPYFRSRYGRVSVERLLCGQGLLDLYHAHAGLAGTEAPYASPAEVTAAAGRGEPIAAETICRFLKILGDVCGDAALGLGARGGVYLCGGVLPRLLDWLPASDFRTAFTNKGRMHAYTAAIPTWVVTAPWTGLLGAAEALRNEEVT